MQAQLSAPRPAHRFLRLILMFTVAVCTAYSAAAQKRDLPSPFAYSITDTAQASKSELYARAKAWVAANFKNAEHVFQVDDPEEGKIVATGVMLYVAQSLGTELCKSTVTFTATINLQDNQYSIKYTDFVHEGCTYDQGKTPSGGSLNNDEPKEAMGTVHWRKLRRNINERAVSSIQAFDKAMKGTGE